MKAKYIALALFLLSLETETSSQPLIIGNSLNYQLSFNVSLKSGNQTISLGAKERWEHEMAWDSFVYLTWSDYAETDRAWHTYKIDVRTQIPSFYKNGGKVIIGKDGSFLYDERKGTVKGGKAQKIDAIP